MDLNTPVHFSSIRLNRDSVPNLIRTLIHRRGRGVSRHKSFADRSTETMCATTLWGCIWPMSGSLWSKDFFIRFTPIGLAVLGAGVIALYGV